MKDVGSLCSQTRSKKKNVDLLALYPGPRHKNENVTINMAALVEDMIELEEVGMEVEDCYLKKMFPENKEIYQYTHKAYLGPIYADTPARHELAGAISHSARMGDMRAFFPGDGIEGEKKCYYSGYAEPKAIQICKRAGGETVVENYYAHDKKIWYNEETMKLKGEATMTKNYPANKTGFHSASNTLRH